MSYPEFGREKNIESNRSQQHKVCLISSNRMLYSWLIVLGFSGRKIFEKLGICRNTQMNTHKYGSSLQYDHIMKSETSIYLWKSTSADINNKILIY